MRHGRTLGHRTDRCSSGGGRTLSRRPSASRRSLRRSLCRVASAPSRHTFLRRGRPHAPRSRRLCRPRRARGGTLTVQSTPSHPLNGTYTRVTEVNGHPSWSHNTSEASVKWDGVNALWVVCNADGQPVWVHPERTDLPKAEGWMTIASKGKEPAAGVSVNVVTQKTGAASDPAAKAQSATAQSSLDQVHQNKMQEYGKALAEHIKKTIPLLLNQKSAMDIIYGTQADTFKGDDSYDPNYSTEPYDDNIMNFVRHLERFEELSSEGRIDNRILSERKTTLMNRHWAHILRTNPEFFQTNVLPHITTGQ